MTAPVVELRAFTGDPDAVLADARADAAARRAGGHIAFVLSMADLLEFTAQSVGAHVVLIAVRPDWPEGATALPSLGGMAAAPR